MKVRGTKEYGTLGIFLHLLAVSFVRYSSARSAEATKGKDFFVAFLNPGCRNTLWVSSTGLQFRLTISNPQTTTAQVKIRYYGLSGLSQNAFSILATKTLTTSLTTRMGLASSDSFSRRSIQVTSTEDVFVQAYIECTSFLPELSSAGGFSVIPTASLSTNYVAATHCETGNCVILITSVASELNTVTVRVRLSSQGLAQFGGVQYSDGNTISQSNLSIGESMQVVCDRCDMTGTLVHSTAPVAVVAGGQSTTLLGSTSKDLVIEQMVPLESIGQYYLLGQSHPPDLIKIVPLRSGVTINVNNGRCYTSTAERQVFFFKRSSSESTMSIMADDQILVARFLDPKLDSGSVDAAMVLPVPVWQWARSYDVFMSVSGAETFWYVAYFGQAQQFAGTKRGTVTTIQCQVPTDSCVNFGGLILGQGVGRSWAIPLRSTIPDFVLSPKVAHWLTNMCGTPSPTVQSSAQTSLITTTSGPLETSELSTGDSSDVRIINTLPDVMITSTTQHIIHGGTTTDRYSETATRTSDHYSKGRVTEAIFDTIAPSKTQTILDTVTETTAFASAKVAELEVVHTTSDILGTVTETTAFASANVAELETVHIPSDILGTITETVTFASANIAELDVVHTTSESLGTVTEIAAFASASVAELDVIHTSDIVTTQQFISFQTSDRLFSETTTLISTVNDIISNTVFAKGTRPTAQTSYDTTNTTNTAFAKGTRPTAQTSYDTTNTVFAKGTRPTAQTSYDTTMIGVHSDSVPLTLTSSDEDGIRFITTGIFTIDDKSSPNVVTIPQTGTWDRNDVETMSVQSGATVAYDDSKTVDVTTNTDVTVENLVTYASTTVSSLQSDQPQTYKLSDKNCCVCKKGESNNTTVTMEIKEKMAMDIKTRLLLHRQNLSSYIRKKRSVYDDRPSAITVGTFVGLGFILLVAAFVLGADCMTITHCSKVKPVPGETR